MFDPRFLIKNGFVMALPTPPTRPSDDSFNNEALTADFIAVGHSWMSGGEEGRRYGPSNLIKRF